MAIKMQTFSNTPRICTEIEIKTVNKRGRTGNERKVWQPNTKSLFGPKEFKKGEAGPPKREKKILGGLVSRKLHSSFLTRIQERPGKKRKVPLVHIQTHTYTHTRHLFALCTHVHTHTTSPPFAPTGYSGYTRSRICVKAFSTFQRLGGEGGVQFKVQGNCNFCSKPSRLLLQ